LAISVARGDVVGAVPVSACAVVGYRVAFIAPDVGARCSDVAEVLAREWFAGGAGTRGGRRVVGSFLAGFEPGSRLGGGKGEGRREQENGEEKTEVE
jgi:hypothetical protein